jgi:hypothetical protein
MEIPIRVRRDSEVLHYSCISGYFSGAAEILGVFVGRAEGVETGLDDSEFGVVVN